MSPIRMKYSEVSPTASQRTTPWRRGRQPTSLTVEREIPVPIRKSVAVRPRRPRVKSDPVMRESDESDERYVLMTAARTKRRMNQGNWMRAPLLLPVGASWEQLRLIAAVATPLAASWEWLRLIAAVASASGTIQR